jgi:hypothetical protein
LINPFRNENDFNGFPKIAVPAEPCPDDRTGSIQYQDKEDRKKLIQMREKLIKILSANYLTFTIVNTFAFLSAGSVKQTARLIL